MNKPVKSLPQNASLSDVLQAFLKHHLEALPIIDAAQRAVGLITYRDLTDVFLPRYYELLRDFAALEDKGQLASVFNQSFAGLDRHQEKLILAADIMQTRIQWILHEQSLLEAASLLRTQNRQSLPVVDRDQKLVGMIADFEIVLALLRGSATAAMKR